MLWRFCPCCYRLADSSSVLKRCPMPSCLGKPNAQLQVLPLPHEAAQAAIRIGGAKALEEMIVGLVAGEDVAQEYVRHHPSCWALHGGRCDMGCEIPDPFA